MTECKGTPGFSLLIAVWVMVGPALLAGDPGRQEDAGALKTASTPRELAELKAVLRTALNLDPKTNVPPDRMSALASDELETRLTGAVETAQGIVVTERDIWALNAYASGEFAKADTILRETMRADPQRTFPAFLRGCVLLDAGKHEDAASAFEMAFKLRPDSRASVLMAAICRQLAAMGTAMPTDEDLLRAYDWAYRTCLERLPQQPGEGRAVGGAFPGPLTFDPLRVRLCLASASVLRQRRTAIVTDLMHQKDVNRKVVLALMTDPETGRTAILRLAEENPGLAELQVYAFLLRHFGRLADPAAPRDAAYASQLARAQQAEPGNGFLLLLGIGMGEKKKPFDETDISLLRKGAQSLSFHTYSYFRADDVARESLNRPWAMFEETYRSGCRPFTTGALRVIMERASLTITVLYEAGQDEQARQMLEAAESIVEKLRNERDAVLCDLAANALAGTLARRLGDYAERAGRVDLLERSLAVRESIQRQEAMYHLAVSGLEALAELPSLRLHAVLFQREPRGLFRHRAERILDMDADQLRTSALEVLADAHDGTYDDSCTTRAIVTVESLKLREAVPTLKRLTNYRNALTRRMAARAISEINAAR